jgi:hypothetical protein
MNKRNYKKKCKALFDKARKLGLKLIFYPRGFEHRRLNCLWYGGELATIKLSETFAIELNIYGEVRAELTDDLGNELASVTDKNNAGAFSKYMLPYIKTDKQLEDALESGKLILGNNNWIEYDGVVKTCDTDTTGVFVDLGMICDNILDDDVLSAIEQALDSIKEIKNEICDVAENHYGIKVGDV